MFPGAPESQRMNRPEQPRAVRLRPYNLADADQSLDFGMGKSGRRFTALTMIAAVARAINPLLGGWLLALSGGRLSLLASRMLRLRRVAGAMLAGSLTPPAPVRLQIETTDVCNLSCIHCRREKLDGMNTIHMPFDSFARIMADARPLYASVAGFGEPLIDPSMIAKLALLHRHAIRTSMPTNGTYIRRRKREALAAELPDVLQLSIDGATKESFEAIRKGADFDAIIENYRAICALRADGRTRPHTVIRILCALQRGNLHDYRAMYRLIQTMPGIDSFGLVPVSYGSAHASQMPAEDDVRALHRDLAIAIAEAPDKNEKNFYRRWREVSAEWLPAETASRPDSTPSSAPCAVPWFSTYIDAKGRVYPCCYLTGTKQVMGVLGKDGSGFAAIWSGAAYRAFRARLASDRANLEGCRSCPRNDAKAMAALNRMRAILPAPGRAEPSRACGQTDNPVTANLH
jgi:radical SAM protein with 4Fe4S-binding SPASM domain